jgi:peptide/nickel transport system permease protein
MAEAVVEQPPGTSGNPLAETRAPAPGGGSPWRIGLRRLRRKRVALAFGALFALLVLACVLAPVWANDVAHTSPDATHLNQTIEQDGRQVDIVSPDGVPIGPTWRGQYFLGADQIGRDVMVRLLYGGRNSLFIGVTAALITTLLGTFLGLLAGYARGWVDGVLTRIFDVIWAFPALLLGIALGTALALGGLSIGPITIAGGSLAIPILVIALVYVPYIARPIRGEVLSLQEQEFVAAARTQGAGPLRVMVGELLPNLASTVLVMFTLLVANAILLEAALSFLGAGVQPPDTSWGTMIQEGVQLITASPHLTVMPGLMLVLTVLSLNVFGDGVREALDPKARSVQEQT